MSECETCGRPDEGHWIGCAEVKTPYGRSEMLSDFVVKALDNMGVLCAHGGCTEPRWSSAPRAQFCTTHKDPKNRK